MVHPDRHSHWLLARLRLREDVHHDAELVVALRVVDHAAEAEACEVGHAAADLAVCVNQPLHAGLSEGVLVGKLKTRLLVGVRVLVLGCKAQAFSHSAHVLHLQLMDLGTNGRPRVWGSTQGSCEDVLALGIAEPNLADGSDAVHCDAGQVPSDLEGGQDAAGERSACEESPLPSELRRQAEVAAGVLHGAFMHVAVRVLEVRV
mmetsp:Transcript_19764/g.31546  ORF Transcript_19764/g.31546 Transcript_19764/m.31546 type:complete len:204 (+) Transcript_19764:37-648(+)